MQALRKRVPFEFKSEDGQDVQVVLDEQEQAQLVEEIKDRNATSNDHNRIALQVMLALSTLLHFIYWLSDRRSPLFAIFPPSSHDPASNAPVPFSGILTYIAILTHVNLSLLVHPRHVVIAGWAIRPIGFTETFAWSAICPVVTIYTGKAWQTTAWWCISTIMTIIVYVVHMWVKKADRDVMELENLQYRAPGA
ncbi:hypothetical protein PISMIDRAFT_674952 [Pisolithus microcarpus 441]|uniref:Uncharacterized protein n=1 Tax=Pisolithus microcarpus 441 TaxID=765257 RepID=A0A0C9ZNM8_9AGAM|nr:hypothetical protein PISMIDRAFT_684288 [Pisolithus microcarpus 441]KIK27559.1 hypothetical protein PISMIDRAFT_674952 [Pisolithus microcarpus 441]